MGSYVLGGGGLQKRLTATGEEGNDHTKVAEGIDSETRTSNSTEGSLTGPTRALKHRSRVADADGIERDILESLG